MNVINKKLIILFIVLLGGTAFALNLRKEAGNKIVDEIAEKVEDSREQIEEVFDMLSEEDKQILEQIILDNLTVDKMVEMYKLIKERKYEDLTVLLKNSLDKNDYLKIIEIIEKYK